MQVTKCDGGCGKESPTPSGNEPANEWALLVLTIPARAGDAAAPRPVTRTQFYCLDCLPRVLAMLDPKSVET